LITKTYKKQKLKQKLTRCNNPHSTPNKRFFFGDVARQMNVAAMRAARATQSTEQ
jgi:hypothetical protein